MELWVDGRGEKSGPFLSPKWPLFGPFLSPIRPLGRPKRSPSWAPIRPPSSLLSSLRAFLLVARILYGICSVNCKQNLSEIEGFLARLVTGRMGWKRVGCGDSYLFVRKM